MARLRITKEHGVQFSGWSIVPVGAGAAVSGTVNDEGDQETQLTLFCRRSNPGWVFLSASTAVPFGEADGSIAKIKDPTSDEVRGMMSGSTLEIGGAAVRQQRGSDGFTNVQVSGHSLLLVYAMTADEFNRGLRSGFAVVVDVPHVWSSTSRFEPQVQGLEQQAAIAFKSCL
jgi:hypothetical protein